MKAEEKTVAFMFFSVVMQFVDSLEEKQKQQQQQKKQQKLGVREGVEKDKSRGTGGPNSSGKQQGTPVKNNRKGPNIIK